MGVRDRGEDVLRYKYRCLVSTAVWLVPLSGEYCCLVSTAVWFVLLSGEYYCLVSTAVS